MGFIKVAAGVVSFAGMAVTAAACAVIAAQTHQIMKCQLEIRDMLREQTQPDTPAQRHGAEHEQWSSAGAS